MPTVALIAGPNGAGKSTTAPRVLRDALHVEEFVNADTIAAGLSAFAPQSVALTAGRLLLERVNELASRGRDFAFETTLASRMFVPWLQDLKAKGYRFHLVYLWLPSPELALARVCARVRRGGHAVEESTLRRRYGRSLANFLKLYSSLASSWVMMDNSAARSPGVIAWRGLGQPVRIVNAQQWSALPEQPGLQPESATLSTSALQAAQSAAESDVLDRMVAAAAWAVGEAVRDHKRAGHPIATWQNGQVTWIAPNDIED